MNRLTKETDVFILLIIVIIFSIFTRVYGIKKLPAITTDCHMYLTIAKNLYKNPLDYSARNFYEMYKKEGRNLPDFVNRKLFVYPPVFCYLIDLSYHLFGIGLNSALAVPSFFGIAIIIIVFLIAKSLYNSKVAILAAILMSIEPINWICSQKVWIETTYTFFASLAILFFIYGLKKKNYFIFTGISLGLALLSKYQAILALVIIVAFFFLRKRQLFFEKKFWQMLIALFIMLLPWIIWSMTEGGFSTLKDFVISNCSFKSFNLFILIFLFVFSCIFILKRLIANSKLNKIDALKTFQLNKTTKITLSLLVVSIILLLLRPVLSIVLSMHIPRHGWSHSVVSGQPGYFYLKRLLELSPIYLFSFISFIYYFKKDDEDFLLILWASIVLIFHILWGNFQSRYILLAVPSLIILAARLITDTYSRIERQINNNLKIISKFGFFLILILFIFKNVWISVILAILDQPCYF